MGGGREVSGQLSPRGVREAVGGDFPDPEALEGGRGGRRAAAGRLRYSGCAQRWRSPAGGRAAALAAALRAARASRGRGRRAGAPGRRRRGAWRGSWRRPGAW